MRGTLGACHGWLVRDAELSWTVMDVPVDPATRTRREEYWWAAEALQALDEEHQTLLDAATGYVPGWHMMPYIAANCGYLVHAVDIDPRHMAMPAHPLVKREMADIAHMKQFPDEAFDVVACISVLEHLGEAERERAAAELVRVARRALIITADDAPWLPELFSKFERLDLGVEVPTPAACIHLSPRVYALCARKLP